MKIHRHPQNTEKRALEYETLWSKAKIIPEREGLVDFIAKRVGASMGAYTDVANATGVPPHVIGVIHYRESDLKFTRHLHNGDPLRRRTTNVPKGRPVYPPANGDGYTWSESAIDALRYEGAALGIDFTKYYWDVANTLFFLERYNGDGYRIKGVNSPYLWSFTDQYTKGYYGQDGKFSKELVNQQAGCVAIFDGLGWQPWDDKPDL